MKWIEVDEIRRKVSRFDKPVDEETRRDILRLCADWEAMQRERVTRIDIRRQPHERAG